MLSRKVLELEIEVEALKSALIGQWDVAHSCICGRVDCVSFGGDQPCAYEKHSILKDSRNHGN